MSKVTVEQARKMTTQEFFNNVWERAKDPTKAQYPNNTFCCYRAPNGSECFVGCNLPDEDYDPDWDNSGKFSEFWGVNFKRIFPSVDKQIARRIQKVHDSCVPELWHEKLREIALSHCLVVPNE